MGEPDGGVTAPQEGVASTQNSGPMRTVAEIMNRDVKSVAENASMVEVMAFFEQRGYGGAPVIDENGQVLGMISKTDIAVRRSKDNTNFSSMTAAQVMTPFVFNIGPEATLLTLIKTMDEYGIHRVVVTEGNKPVGIVTTMDLIRDYGKVLEGS